VRRLLILLLCTGCGIDADSVLVYEQGADALRALHVLLASTTPMLAIDVTQSSDQNAAAIQQHAMSTLGPCASVMRSGNTVTVEYTAASCGSGSMTLVADQSGGTVTVTQTLSSFVISNPNGDAELLSGPVILATQDGARLSVNTMLDDSGGQYLGPYSLSANLTFDGNTIDGMTNLTASNATTAVMFDAVVWTDPDCTPKGGSLEVTSGSIADSAKFDARTKTTGQVQVVWAKGTSALGFPGCVYQ
jgi:hypothetical protein